MMKRLTAAALCLLLFFAAGCKKDIAETSSETETSAPAPVTQPQPEPEKYINPLTGLSGIDANKVKTRPVAIMINNIKTAQGVQTGLNAADIIYETEVEGGITRLLAVYQDVSSVQQIGTIRSARYPYIDLSMGHNAIYVHNGQDPTYAAPHLKDTDDLTVSENNYGKRISNGLASEHTLYTFGEKLWNGLSADGWKTAAANTQSWQSFAPEEQQVALSGGACNSVSVAFSTSYNTTFKYDAASASYTRYSNGTALKDYKSKELTTVKNVFAITTTISDYPDGKHRKVALEGGDGYYITNGTYTPIKWSKGKSTAAMKFTNVDGTPLTVSAGDSWVCISDKNTSQPVIQ